MKQTIFISYSWANADLADKIDSAFLPTGLIIKRDIREIGYKGSIKEFMQQVRSTDFVLLIISDNFLKSPNAMFEVLELLKDQNFKNKILPVVVDNTKIYKPEHRLEYIKYWTDQHSDLEIKLKKVGVTDSIELYKDLKHYEKIRTTIDEFMGIIVDMNSPTFSALSKDNFQKIFTYIGVSDQVMINEVLSLNELKSNEEKDIEIDKLEKKYPNNSKIYFTKGYYAFERKEINKSSYFYRKSIEIDSTFSPSYYNLGYNAEFFDKDYEEAKKLYEKAIELEPRTTKVYTNLAGLYSSHFANPLKAKDLLEIALDINPYDSVAHYNLALILHKDFDNDDEAKNHYEFAIQIKADFTEAKHNYGMLLWKKFEKFADAKEQFLEILEIEPKNKATLKQLATLLELEYKHYETAKLYFDRFIIIEPNEASDHELYAMFLLLYFRKSQKGLARKHYDIACSMDKSIASKHFEVLLN